MLDIRFIRENADLVERKSKQKGYDVDIRRLIQLDEERRQLLSDIEMVRSERNKLIDQAKGQTPSAEAIEHGKHLKQHIADCEERLRPVDEAYWKLLKSVPNMPSDDVPIGASEDENVEAKKWGDIPHFDFKPKTHWQIGNARGWIDKERAAKVAGSRFTYLKGDLVRLQLAIMQFVIELLTDEENIKKIIQFANLNDVSSKTFVPVLPPFMIRTEVFEAMDRLEPRSERYKVGSEEDNLWLQGSAEHTLGPMYKDETIPSVDLPLRYLGYATSFRREAGTYGKDTEGIIRLHQFDKLEMESFVSPDAGMSEHLLMVAIQEYLMQQLKLPYRILQKCTADIGKPNARGIDIEAWLPGEGVYKETHTADYMTDYQARRLGTRTKLAAGEEISKESTEYVHTNDATAFALGRTMVAIIENNQTAEGKVKIPEALQKYMGDQAEI